MHVPVLHNCAGIAAMHLPSGGTPMLGCAPASCTLRTCSPLACPLTSPIHCACSNLLCTTCRNEQLLDALGAQARRIAQHMNEQAVANMAWACAKLDYRCAACAPAALRSLRMMRAP